MAKFKVASLFSGAGGLDLGFVQSGAFEVVFANDLLLPAARTHSRNFGLSLMQCGEGRPAQAEKGAALACDVERVDFSPLSGEGIDVVVGGPPCQDFSIVRGPSWDRRGIEVKRGRLYMHFVRALAALQPKAFVFENVPGLLSANDGAAYRVIYDDFSRLSLRWREVEQELKLDGGGSAAGYEVLLSEVVDFSALGVPQRRRRLVMVGLRRDLIGQELGAAQQARRALKRALEGEGWLFRKYPLTAIEAFEGSTLQELGGRYREVMKKWEGVWAEAGTPQAQRWKSEVWDRLTFDAVQDYLAANGVKPLSSGELEEAMRQHELALRELGYYGSPVCSSPPEDGTCEAQRDDPSVVKRMRLIPPGENHEFVRGTECEVEGRGISLIYRRLHPLQPSYTVVAYGGGGTHGYHYDRDRCSLTLREKARLQTFPDSFLFEGGRSEIRAQIGEAVPPLAAKRLAEALALVLSSAA